LFYLAWAISTIIFVVGTLDRISMWRRGEQERGSPLTGRGLLGMLWLSLSKFFSLDCLLARRAFVRSPIRGLLLLSVEWTSLLLILAVIASAVDLVYPLPFLAGETQLIVAAILDYAGGFMLIGLLFALGRRYVFPPERTVSVASDAILLGLFALIVFFAFVLEGARLAPVGWAMVQWWPVGTLFGQALVAITGSPAEAWALAYPWLYLVHAGLAFVLFAYLPFSKLFHLFAAQITTAAARERKLARMRRRAVVTA
jgi:nitrate reductase gamma subunit